MIDRDRSFYLLSVLSNLLWFQLWWKWRFRSSGRRSFWISPARIIGVGSISLGSFVRILHHARIEVLRVGETSGSISIGDNVHIGHNFFCTCAAEIRIHSGVLISDNVAVIDNSHVYCSDSSPTATRLTSADITIFRNVTIYRNATILAGVTIGEGSVIGAGSVVKSDVPPFSLVAGSPATFKKSLKLNTI